MVSKQGIVILFKLLNFGLLLGIMQYLWRKYGKPYMVDQLAQQREEHDGMKRTHTVLLQEKKSIARTNRIEEKERSQLKEQLQLWRHAIEQERETVNHEREIRQKALKKRIIDQVQCVEKHQQYDELYKRALHEVRAQLERQYAESAAQKQFLATMFKRMDKNA